MRQGVRGHWIGQSCIASIHSHAHAPATDFKATLDAICVKGWLTYIPDMTQGVGRRSALRRRRERRSAHGLLVCPLLCPPTQPPAGDTQMSSPSPIQARAPQPDIHQSTSFNKHLRGLERTLPLRSRYENFVG